MRVTVNGEERQFPSGISVAKALELLGLTEFRGIAVELNGAFVERDTYASAQLGEQARLELVRFVGGG